MKTVELLLSSDWVLPMTPDRKLLTHYAVAVDQGKILDLFPLDQINIKYTSKQHLHLPGHVLMPGLINAHTHSPMNLFRGLADDLELMTWLQQYIWPAEADLINEESVKVGSTLAIAEMLRTGTTCFNEHYFFPQATAEAVKATGIRACLGFLMMDVTTQWAKNGEEALEKCLLIHKEFKTHPLITWAWAPHAPYTLSDKTFRKLFEVNQTQQLPVHIHLHETATEIAQSLQQHRKRPIERLDELGLLSPKLIAVHMTQITDSDQKLIQSNGVNLVHCPESNLKLASGLAPIARMMAQNINVALGTDGAASNNDLDMFSEMRTAALIAKVESNDPTSLSSFQALEMATINGAKALQLQDQIGSLEVGKAADLIAVDLSPYYNLPVYNPISHLVYAVNAQQVSYVWVNGRCLLAKGQLTELDTRALLAECKGWFDRVKQYKKPD